MGHKKIYFCDICKKTKKEWELNLGRFLTPSYKMEIVNMAKNADSSESIKYSYLCSACLAIIDESFNDLITQLQTDQKKA